MVLPDRIPEQPGAQPSHPQQILVIEDEVLIAMMIEQLLTDAGYEVITAFSGEEALAKAATIDRLALVVTDLGLAFGIDGRSVLRELRANNAVLPAVVVTGFGAWQYEADLRGVGGPTARLIKPFGAEELTTCVANLLSGSDRPPEQRRRRNRTSDLNDVSC